ncbi:MAG: DUF4350 domain-containing protein [Methylococcales bacterium]
MAYKHRLTLLLSILLVVLIASWFFNNFTRVSKTIRQDQSPAARRNSLLAAQRFLQSLGHQVESIHGREILVKLPATNDVIVIKHFFTSLAEDKETALLKWVADGGHLVASLGKDYDMNARSSGYSLFDTLKIHRHSDVDMDADADTETQSFQYYEDLETGIATFDPGAYLHIGSREVEFAIVNSTISNENLSDDDNQKTPYHFVQFSYGQGLITLSSDNAFLTNNAIGDHDHAWLLSLIVETQQDPGKIWLLYDLDMPSLWSLLMTYAAPIVSSVVLALLLWLWMAMQRSGPIEETIEIKRRNILEHLNMRSQYLWRHGKHKETLAKTQQLVLESWQQHYPLLLKLNTSQQMEWISKQSGLDLTSTRQALLETPDDNNDLIIQAQRLQHLQTGYPLDKASRINTEQNTHRSTP